MTCRRKYYLSTIYYLPYKIRVVTKKRVIFTAFLTASQQSWQQSGWVISKTSTLLCLDETTSAVCWDGYGRYIVEKKSREKNEVGM